MKMNKLSVHFKSLNESCPNCKNKNNTNVATAIARGKNLAKKTLKISFYKSLMRLSFKIKIKSNSKFMALIGMG